MWLPGTTSIIYLFILYFLLQQLCYQSRIHWMCKICKFKYEIIYVNLFINAQNTSGPRQRWYQSRWRPLALRRQYTVWNRRTVPRHHHLWDGRWSHLAKSWWVHMCELLRGVELGMFLLFKTWNTRMCGYCKPIGVCEDDYFAIS